MFLRRGIPGDPKARPRTGIAFAPVSTPVEAGGAPLQVHSHADPFAADWDGDGLLDLVVGAGDGSVGWYRNEGTAQAPRLGPRRELVVARSATDCVERTFGADGALRVPTSYVWLYRRSGPVTSRRARHTWTTAAWGCAAGASACVTGPAAGS